MNRAFAKPSIIRCCIASGAMFSLSLRLRRRWCRAAGRRSTRRSSRSPARRSRGLFERSLHSVTFERARRCELAQLVPHHLLGDVNGDELLPVMHSDGVADHVRQNRRTPRPRFHHFLFVARIHPFDFFAQMLIDKRTLLQRTWHRSSILYSSTRRSFTHCARRIRRKPRTGPGTRCDTGQNGQTNRVPCALGSFSTTTAQLDLHSRYIVCGGGITTLALRTGFTSCRTCFRARAARPDTLRVVRVTLIVLPSISRRAGIIYCLPFPLQTCLQNSLRLAPLYNHAVRRFLLSRLRSQRREAPRGLRMISLHASFTAAVRMIHRIHRHASHRWPTTMPPRPTRFAVRHVLMIQISELPDGRHAIHRKLPSLTRRQLHQSDLAFLAQKLRRAARGPHELSAFSGRKLQIMDHRPRRNMPDRQRVSRQNVRSLAVLHRHTHFQPHRMQNVTLLPVGIVQQRNARRTVRVVFNRGNLRRDARLVATIVDHSILLLMPAASVPNRDFAVRVPPARSLLRLDQRLLRLLLGNFALVEHGQEAPRRCVGSK